MQYARLLAVILLFVCNVSYAQEETVTTLRQGKKYVELNLNSLEKYNKRIQREQKKLLTRLSKKENRLLRKLKKNDSAAYVAVQDNPLTYDSIRTLIKADSSTKLAKTRNKTNRSLRHMATVNTGGQSNTVQIDDLEYKYLNTGASNKLQYVRDNVNATTNATYNQNDFIDRHTNYTDYSYDDDGNLTKDLNKNIGYIHYNHLGLPYEIGTTTGNTIYYTYDAEGNKLREEVQDGTGNAVYDYVKQFIYKNNDLQLLNHQEGRCRWLADSNIFKYDFFVKDHLGNVRTVLTTDEYTGVWDYEATHELAAASKERLIFDNIDHTRDTKPEGSPDDMEAALLNGSESDSRIGTALAIKVMAGDKIHLKTYGYWEENGDMNTHAAAEDMVESIINSLSGTAQGMMVGEAGGATVVNNLFNLNNYNDVFDAIKEDATNPEKPRAYLNYIFYDHEMNIVPEQSGVLQLDGEANEWFEMDLANDIQVGQNGYLVAYLSNEQFMDVYFDNMLVTHYRGRQLEEQHYYPHGLVINNSSIPSLVDRQRLYQTKEWNKDLALYDFHARQYDPQLGRFTSLDPKKQFSSGYIGMGNNPIIGVDPDGQWVNFVIGAVIGGIGGYMIGNSMGATGWDMAAYIIAGAAIGAASSGMATAVTAGVSSSMGVAASSSVAGGALAGAAGGATGGMISGFGMAMLSGGNTLKAAGKGALYGAASGAVLGGASQGLRNIRAGNNFWSGRGSIHYKMTGESTDDVPASTTKGRSYNRSTAAVGANDRYLRSKVFMNNGIQEGDIGIQKITTRTYGHGLNESNFYVTPNGDIAEAFTIPYTNGSIIHISPGVLHGYEGLEFTGVVGHELVHAYHRFTIPSSEFNSNMSERAAWSYNARLYMENSMYDHYTHVINTATSLGQWGPYDLIYQVPKQYTFWTAFY